jgi:hypothetical protein
MVDTSGVIPVEGSYSVSSSQVSLDLQQRAYSICEAFKSCFKRRTTTRSKMKRAGFAGSICNEAVSNQTLTRDYFRAVFQVPILEPSFVLKIGLLQISSSEVTPAKLVRNATNTLLLVASIHIMKPFTRTSYVPT